MKINLKDMNPGVFFPWPGEMADSKSGITVRPLNASALKRINAKTLLKEKIMLAKGGIPYKDILYDEKLKEILVADYCIVEWTGLEDDNEDPIECTPENKAMIMGEHPQLMEFVSDKIDSIPEIIKAKEETETKN